MKPIYPQWFMLKMSHLASSELSNKLYWLSFYVDTFKRTSVISLKKASILKKIEQNDF